MKKLLFGLIATMFLGNLLNAQEISKVDKTKLFCVTVSCCSVGPFSVEIWSETTCHYVSVKRTASLEKFTHTMSFQTAEPIKTLDVYEDVILAGQYDVDGNHLVLPKGTYTVENSSINFKAQSLPIAKAKKYCYIKEVKGTLFGHDYEYTIELCISFGSSNRGVVSVTPKLSSEELSKILNSEDRTITIDQDVTIKENDLNYTLKSGKYIVNEDGNIYLQGTIVK